MKFSPVAAAMMCLLLAGCADPKAVDMSVPPNSSSSSTVTTSATVVTAPATATPPAQNSAAPAEETKWKMHVDDRSLICGPHDRDIGKCD